MLPGNLTCHSAYYFTLCQITRVKCCILTLTLNGKLEMITLLCSAIFLSSLSMVSSILWSFFFCCSSWSSVNSSCAFRRPSWLSNSSLKREMYDASRCLCCKRHENFQTYCTITVTVRCKSVTETEVHICCISIIKNHIELHWNTLVARDTENTGVWLSYRFLSSSVCCFRCSCSYSRMLSTPISAQKSENTKSSIWIHRSSTLSSAYTITNHKARAGKGFGC